ELATARGASAQELAMFTEQDIALQKQLLDVQRQSLQSAISSGEAWLAFLETQRDTYQKNIADLTALAAAQGKLGDPGVQASLQAYRDKLVDTGTEIVTQTAQLEDYRAQLAANGVQYGTLATQAETAFTRMQEAAAKTAFISTQGLGQMFDQIITGILQGTQNLGDLLASTGQALGVKFFQQLLVGKQGFDQQLVGNISDLVFNNQGGVIGNLFGLGGALAAKQFTSGWDLSGIGGQFLRGVSGGGAGVPGATGGVAGLFGSGPIGNF